MLQEADAYMGQGDLSPPLLATLKDAFGKPIDLSSALSARFHARHQTRNKTIDGPASMILPLVDGRVQYLWLPGDTDIPGTYDLQFIVTWVGNRPQSVPNSGYKQLYISKALV